MATPHNAADINQIAKTVLLPGDSQRAKYIAEKYFENPKLVSDVRNVLAYTGTYKGKPITIMGSGMGAASAGLYSYELYHFYNVENIIRIGTAGGLQPNLEPGDLVFALTASTDSAYGNQYALKGTFSPAASYDLLEKAVASAKNHNISHHVGTVFSSDYFSDYNALNQITQESAWKPWAKMGCLVQDMETYALYSNAAWLSKNALSILTHTDSCVHGHKHLPYENRLPLLENMFTVALDVASQL
ncbi:MAG: purine-nucleoside phosphorylase [Spirochaetaceae bacterium]|nr:purine-nucleoside phosphorylase [Spirochaetaceae bacterium]